MPPTRPALRSSRNPLSARPSQRRTGVAISDPTGLLARSLAIIEQRGRDRRLPEVVSLVKQHDVERIVVGYPVHMDGQPGAQASYVESYVRALARALEQEGLEIEAILWDERLSTQEAREILREQSEGSAGQRRLVDAIAAAVILQGYLDHQREEKTGDMGSG